MINIQEKISQLTIEKRAFIDGEYMSAIDGDIIQKVSPVDGRDISGISACKEGDINLAVAAAKRSFDSRVWLHKHPQEKKEILFDLADSMNQHLEELAMLDTLETGRAFKNYFHDSIPKAIAALRYFAEAIDKYYDHIIPPRPREFATITREALGVVGLITPWNDPMVVAIWKLAPALLMGNSVVIKPAEQSSFSILRVAGLALDAGIPKGVVNVITGFGEVAGKALALHNDVSALYFTGSSDVGKKILQYSGQSNMKKVGLECGGKSPFIVSTKCTNLERAATVLAKNMFYNQGQICSAPSRAIVQHEIKSEFLDLLKNEYVKYCPQDPFDRRSEVGCIVSQDQQNRIQRLIHAGIKDGIEIYTAKTQHTLHPNSIFVLPTIFVTDDNQSIVAREEIFGPVLTLLGVETIEQAVSTANESKFGLAASIWTNDMDEAYWVPRRLDAGIVHVNSYGEDDNCVPFGGIKESGIGKDKSIYAFDEYCYFKTTWVHYQKIV